MRRSFPCILACILLSTVTCFSQQSEVLRYQVIGGYSYLHVPSLNLAQRGFNGDLGINVRPWLSMGFDFSVFTGHSTLLPSYFNSATQLKLAQALGQMGNPPIAGIPYSSTTFTYQAGPQLNYRRFRKVTLFVRPALGLLHEKIQTHPAGCGQYQLQCTALVKGLLGGKLSAADNTVFYGFGGGATWEINPHFGLRATADFARFNLFPDTLNGSRNGVRLSVMPKFGFGKNIMHKY